MANITGTTSNDKITVSEAYYISGKKNVSLGNGSKATNGDDTISTGNGDDYIDAGAGNDTIGGGNGSDIIYGGLGDDTIWGDALGNPDANDNGQDELYGGAGNDTMYGGNGKDYLDGGDDNDNLFGNNGTDILLGGAGNDKLTGGLGGDVLAGGTGADTFIYATNTASAVSDSPYSAGLPGIVTGSGINTGWTKSWDVIRDFSHAQGDKIDLSQLDSYLPTGVDLVWRSPIGTDASAGSANAGLAYGVWTDASGNFLYADITGDGKADMKIQVSGVGADDLIGVTKDTSGPTVTITFGDADGLINDADNADGTIVTFQFSEPVVSFDTAQVTTSAGTLSNWTQIDADTWTAMLNVPTDGDGTATVSVAAGSYVDFSSNGGAANSADIDYDTSNPTVVSIDLIDEVDGSMNPVASDDVLNIADGTATVRIVFSEAVESFAAADLGVTNGTVTNLSSTDGITWFGTFTAASDVDGSGSVSVTAGGYTDVNGNSGGAGGPATIAIDNIAPTVTISFDDSLVTDADEPAGTVVTFTFSSDVDAASVDTTKITATNGSFDDATWHSEGNVLTVTFHANDNFDGNAVISVASDAFADDGGNPGTAANENLAVDTVNPTLVSIVFEDSALADNDDTSNVTITFSEAVGDINSYLSGTNGTPGTFATTDGGVTWNGTFQADQDVEGSGSITVADGYTDLNGNTGIGGNGGGSVDIDTANPTVTIGFDDTLVTDADAASGTQVTFTFSPDVDASTVDTSLITATHGTLSGWTPVGNVLTATFDADDGFDGNATISVASGAFADDAGNAGVANSEDLAIDTANPTVELSLSPTTLTDGAPSATLTITFSEAIDPTTLSLGDFTYDTTLGTLSALTPDANNTVWTATYTANDNNDATGATIALNGAYADVAGNSGSSDSVTFDIDRDEGGPPPPPAVDHIVFTPSADFAKDGDINGVTIGQFTAYDANGNVITGLDWTTVISDKVSINATGAMIANGNLNQGDFEFDLFGTTVHLGLGNGSGNDLGSNVLAYAGDLQILLGLGGGDTLNGDALGDTLWGGNAADTLIGSGGNDILIGGASGDSLTGGAGDDSFMYFASTDSVVGARDTITGFEDANDVIDLQALNASSFSSQVVSGNTILSVDLNGDSVADMSILLTGVHTLDSGNILI